MELAGDEKRIQALFSELSRDDAQAAPRFEKLWREASPAQRVPPFSKPLVVIVATLIVAFAVLFVTVSRDKAPAEQNVQNLAPQPIPSRPASQALKPDNSEPDNKVAQRRTPSHSHRRRTLARRPQREPALAQQAAMLANWKSPTENFMTSPTRSVFNSLPQLDESAKDLESFLSTKELNQ